ncbi:MAG: ORF6N domain-containing protein [Halobacteriovoraceae bacterium]|nr:ORF6N domain-containing protein [Halobacteriovoraceae bacterium]MBT5093520.1 ORF6N domain-containing protein [Halobacteriovoraceae bacterium]
MIFLIRGKKVMLDSDLAELYGITTKRLNEQVKRNRERFPSDFMFQCDTKDLSVLRSQFATSNGKRIWNHKRRTLPLLFSENGVAMLSSVLKSKRAIQVNISIMRIFTKLRSFLLLEKKMEERMDGLEQGSNILFKNVFERLDTLEENGRGLDSSRKKIGIRTNISKK